MNIKAIGIANKSSNGDILDVFYPNIEFGNKKINNKIKDINSNDKEIIIEFTQEDLNRPIENVQEAYLKLHLLSYRLVLPNSINLDGLFNCLPNVAWTNIGPIGIDDIDLKLQESKYGKNNIFIRSIDKFPCLTDYIIPKNVRIADASRVRLGAYLSEGTTIMHEGFVNFNAGTEGVAMIEGRISAGVLVGSGSDLGGSSSTMGTLSGGGTELVSVGENCLIGANAGIGFPLADGCTIEAGLYVTAGMKINRLDENGVLIEVVKAKDISSVKNLVFRRNSLSGNVECIPDANSISLNEELHSHN